MIRRTVRGFIHVLGGFVAGLVIMLMVVAWQLSSGPISLAFLSPYIENTINSDQRNFKLKLKDTILTWAGWDRTLDIRVLGVRVLRADGTLVGSVPEVSFSLSGRALVRGLLAPKSVELFGPRLRVRRAAAGQFDVGFLETESGSGDFARRVLDQLLAAPDPRNAMSYLDRLEVVSAEVTLKDELLGKSWVAPSTNFSLRRDAIGLVGNIRLELDVEGRRTEISVDGGYQTAGRRMDLTVNFGEVSPAAFSAIYYGLGPLSAVKLPVKGTVALGMGLNGRVEAASFEVTGGKGILELPKPVGQTLPVEKIVVAGRYQGDEDRLEIDKLNVALGPDAALTIPAAADHRMPVKSLALKGSYSGRTNRLEITDGLAELGGPAARFSVIADGFQDLSSLSGGAEMSVDAKGTLVDVPIDEVKRYWPANWGADAHRWVTKHLKTGAITQARAEVRLWSGGDGGFELVSVEGDMSVAGTVVDYLPPMPPVQGVDAYITYDDKRFDIFVSKGQTEGLTVREGTIRLTGLDEYDQYADVTLEIEGPFGAKLAYMDHEPLRYASAIGIAAASAKGDAETQLKLKFILENDLTLDQVKVSAKSTIKHVSVAKAVLGRDIVDGALAVSVDKSGMDVTGRVKVGNIPADLTWRENFGAKAPFKRRYDLKAKIADTRDIAGFGLDVAPFTDKYVRGALDADVRFTMLNATDRRLEIKTDITDAELSAPAFGWAKQPGVPGTAAITVDFKGDRIVGVPTFAVNAKDLTIAGKARYRLAAAGGGLQRIDFERVTFGRTDIKGALIARPEGGWDAGFHGASFDMSALWEDVFKGDGGGGGTIDLPYVTLAVELERVWIGPDRTLNNISGTFAHKKDLWSTVLVKGDFGPGKSFELTVRPGADGNRRLVMTSEDAGETLRAMDLFGNMKGGRLEINGRYADGAPGRPLIGTIKVSGYRIVDAPVLTRVLSIMALTGIIEAMQGEGLAFNDLEIPFELGQGWLEIRNAKATGNSLGFTAAGTVYTYADIIDISGTVVPAYAINSALGKIPVLGDIFTGGEKGGGVFAANYTMSGPAGDPKITVNPLSALTPGIFRNVFDIFGQLDGRPNPPEDATIQ